MENRRGALLLAEAVTSIIGYVIIDWKYSFPVAN